jgi:hypothetical protein
VIFASAGCWAAEANQPAKPAPVIKEVPEARINAVLDRISQHDPNRAEKLRELRKSDPEAFAQEMKKGGWFPPKRGEVKERLEQMHNEYMKWLEKNYPKEAANLVQAKEKNPDQYFHLLKENFEKYGKIARADKENPELAKVLREDLKVKAEITKVVEDLKSASDESQKSTLNANLKDLVAKRFDLILQQKQLHYQELNKRIERLKTELKKQETELEKYKAKKDQEVTKRVNELLNQNESFDWE